MTLRVTGSGLSRTKMAGLLEERRLAIFVEEYSYTVFMIEKDRRLNMTTVILITSEVAAEKFGDYIVIYVGGDNPGGPSDCIMMIP